MTWQPAQYDLFQAERSQPARDLMALIEARPGMTVVDLGCGTGRLTRELHQRLEAASTLGLDSSSSMLEQAREMSEPGLSFVHGDVGQFEPPGGVDLIYSNAALQWLDDHANLWPRLRRWLRPGGQLAVQMPANYDHSAHRLAAEVASSEPFRQALGGHVRESPVQPVETYAQWLHDLGFARQHVRLQLYGHTLPSRADVVEWVKGTLLTDYLGRLPVALQEQFLAVYRERLFERLEDRRPFFYPFKRILMWGVLD